MLTSLLFQKKKEERTELLKIEKKNRAFKEYPWLPLDN